VWLRKDDESVVRRRQFPLLTLVYGYFWSRDLPTTTEWLTTNDRVTRTSSCAKSCCCSAAQRIGAVDHAMCSEYEDDTADRNRKWIAATRATSWDTQTCDLTMKRYSVRQRRFLVLRLYDHYVADCRHFNHNSQHFRSFMSLQYRNIVIGRIKCVCSLPFVRKIGNIPT